MSRKLNAEKRASLLSAALKLFVAQGVSQTSTAAIAQEAGVAAGTLFLYFPTKQNLIHELVLKIGREQSAYINALLTPTLSVRETFFTIWTGSVRWFLENMDAYHYVRQVRDSGWLDPAVVQESEKFFGYYYEAIQRGLAEGCLKAYPVEVIGAILYQDIVAVLNLISAQPDPAQQAAYIQWGFDIFWDGISAAAGQAIHE